MAGFQTTRVFSNGRTKNRKTEHIQFKSPCRLIFGTSSKTFGRNAESRRTFRFLSTKIAGFFIHFDDNRVWINETTVPGKYEDAGNIWNENDTEFLSRIDLNAVKLHNEYVAKRKEEIKNSIYESESYTADRIIEVIFNYFVKNGKIKPVSLLEKAGYKRFGKNGEYEYNTYDGKTYSYIDFKDLFLTINTHEG